MCCKLPVSIVGQVVEGNKLGRTIDMPTANIFPDIDCSGLAFGVYYSKVLYKGKTYKGISNIGTKPTVQNEHRINVETYIYGFTGNLYGETITVELLEFKRPEMKFESFEALSAQMHQDMSDGLKYNHP